MIVIFVFEVELIFINIIIIVKVAVYRLAIQGNLVGIDSYSYYLKHVVC